MYINVYMSSFKCHLCLPYFNKSSFSRQISEKFSNTKFHKCATIDSRKEDGWTDRQTKLVVGFRNFGACDEKYGDEYKIRARNVTRTVLTNLYIAYV